MSQFFASGGQSIGVSASTSDLPVNTEDSPLEWTGWISLQSKGLSTVFSTTVQKRQFFSIQISLQSKSHIHTWLWKNHSSDLVQFSHSVVSDSLQPHGLQQARLPCPSPTLGAYSNSCPSHQWCHPTISSSVIPFSSHLQSFPASGSFPMSWIFASGGQSIQLPHQSFQWIFRVDFL